MADRPSVRDEDRLPWLDSVEGERARGRKPVSRGVLVGLLAAFFGIGLAVAFSLGYRIAQPAAQAPTHPVQPPHTASVQVPLKPPVLESVAPEPAVVEPAAVVPKPIVVAKPAIKKTSTVHQKAKPRHVRHRKPVLRPFINVKRHTAAPAPVRRLPPPVRVGPRGRMVQLGAYSTVRQADSAYRSIVWRYPYLAKKPKLVVTTPPVGGHQYYRLQLGTDSQAQSLVICQYLQARGQSCIVLY